MIENAPLTWSARELTKALEGVVTEESVKKLLNAEWLMVKNGYTQVAK